MKIFLLELALFALFFCILCRPKPSRSYFGIESWRAYDFQDQSFFFKDIKSNGLILNFYSPICQPCIEEIPALNLLYEETKKRQMTMFLAVEQQLSRHGMTNSPKRSQKDSEKSKRTILIRRIQKDIQAYRIDAPFVIMDQAFQIAPDELVQATPETLFFRMSPFQLKYNLVGALATNAAKEKIQRNIRFQYALEKLNEL